jgi:NDP-sugar pyrophosphorylase family protein
MKAMIFAAGLGTRLRPLTDNRPKALVEILGKTLLEIVINRLKNFGFNEIIINIHHFSEMMKEYLKSKNNFDIRIEISDETDLLLDTGGGLKKAAYFFDDGKPFLVHNVDVISNINLTDFYDFHLNSDSLATIAVKQRNTARMFLFDNEKTLVGWENNKTGEIKQVRNLTGNETRAAFSCMHIISPQIFNLIDEKGAFSIIDLYLRLAENQKIQAYFDYESLWMDLGKPENIEEIENNLLYKTII